MIADLSYKFEIGDHYFPDYPPFLRERKWFCQHMKGVFMLKPASSAHWETHIQISHPDDGVIIKMMMADARTYTESINGGSRIPQRVFTSVEEYDQYLFKVTGKLSLNVGYHYERILFGDEKLDVMFVRDWLRKYPYPIASLSDAIRSQEHIAGARSRA